MPPKSGALFAGCRGEVQGGEGVPGGSRASTGSVGSFSGLLGAFAQKHRQCLAQGRSFLLEGLFLNSRPTRRGVGLASGVVAFGA